MGFSGKHFSSESVNYLPWSASTQYLVNQAVMYSKNIYICVVAHTSGSSFEADLASGNWQLSNQVSTANKNYLAVNNFEDNDTGGFTLGTVTLDSTTKFPNAAPTFGSGASGNLSITTVTGGSQLAGTYSLSLVSSAATTAGNLLASSVFTIDKEDLAKMMKFRFSYMPASGGSNGNFSGTTSNSFGVALYDVTNSQWIQPSGCFSITSSSSTIPGQAYGEFQTSATGTQYRLVIYNANATSGAITMTLDSFETGPQKQSYGSPVTDYQSFVPTVTGSSSNPTKASATTDICYWRRVGSNIELNYQYLQNAAGGAAGSGTYYLSLPSGISIDTAKTQTGTNYLFGKVDAYNGTNEYDGTGYVVDSTHLAMQIQTALNTYTPLGSANVSLGNTRAQWSFQVTLPVVGWSSSVIMSSDANTNVVAQQAIAGAQTPTGTPSTGSGGVCKFNSITKDTNGSYSSSTGQYTVSTPGYYFVSTNVEMTHSSVSVNSTIVGANILVNSTVNHSNWVRASSTSVLDYIVPVSGIVYANAGDTIQINGYSNGTSPSFVAFGSSALYGSSLSINKISGPAQISSGAIVATRAYKAANQTISTNGSAQKILFDTTSFDTTGSWASNKFTAPTAGIYDVSAYVEIAAANVISNDYILFIYKNGASYSYQYGARPGTGVNFGLSAKDTISLLAGDYIEIYFYGAGNNSVSTITMTSGSDKSSVAIKKIGGVY